MFGAIASLATTGISAGASFYQGLRQQKLAKEAEREAGIAFAKAMNLLDVNAFENMSVNKQDIELARTAIDTRSQAMLQQAAEQGVRGIASVAGVMGQNQVASELSLLADASRREQDRKNKILSQKQANIAAKTELRKGEAEGAARAAANREDLAQGAFKSAGEGLIKGVTTALSIPKLYPEKKTTTEGDGVEKTTITQENTGSATNPGKEVVIEEPVKDKSNESSVVAPPQTKSLSLQEMKTWSPDTIEGLSWSESAKIAWDMQGIGEGGGSHSDRYFKDGTPAKYDYENRKWVVDGSRTNKVMGQ